MRDILWSIAMIRKLKRKFIITATVSEFILMLLLVSFMNMINYRSVVRETDAVLDVLARLSAPFAESEVPKEFPENESPSGASSEAFREAPEAVPPPVISPAAAKDQSPAGEEMADRREGYRPESWHGRRPDDFLPQGMSPEAPYEARFFSVVLNEAGEITESDISMIISVEDDDVSEYVRKALGKNADRGFVEGFRFVRLEEETGTRLLFLDCGRWIKAFRMFVKISMFIGLSGCLAVFLVFLFAASRIVRPIAESYEKQKRFITDAGHEMKTPLTVISANADLLEADFGENECLTDIRQQTKRLSELTGNLVYLSRMEETENQIQKVEFPLSDLVSETASSFRAVAEAGHRSIAIRVEEGITLFGSPDATRQLVSVLVDNAVKYSPPGEVIRVSLVRKKKAAELSVSNATAEAIVQEDLSYVFDRFYRTDRSRSSSTGGYGIGLSIAKAIVEGHGGIISAHSETGHDFCVTAELPFVN